MSTHYTASVFYGVQVKIPEAIRDHSDDNPEKREKYFKTLSEKNGLKAGQISSPDDEISWFVYCPRSYQSVFMYGEETFDPTMARDKPLLRFIDANPDILMDQKPRWVLGLSWSC